VLISTHDKVHIRLLSSNIFFGKTFGAFIFNSLLDEYIFFHIGDRDTITDNDTHDFELLVVFPREKAPASSWCFLIKSMAVLKAKSMHGSQDMSRLFPKEGLSISAHRSLTKPIAMCSLGRY
jgi:hypothetical protein